MPWQVRPFKDVTDERFVKLVARWPVGRRLPTGRKPGNGNEILWLCSCDCGSLTVVSLGRLSSGNTKSCGCLKRENARELGLALSGRQAVVHGHCRSERRTPGYDVWRAMLQRCENPNCESWKDYGGRGITVCERWHTFIDFLADMGIKPKGLSIDRIDNDGNYEPGNCKWSTQSEQNFNQRRSIKNKIRELNSKTKRGK